MTAAPAEFYDAAMTAPESRAMLPAEESPWLPMYQEAAGWIKPHEPIVDLGCGTGRFAVVCAGTGHTGGYTGFDFAAATAEQARLYVHQAAPGYHAAVSVADLREWKPEDIRVGHTVYVCLEVLEHLDDDVGLIERVPGGHRLIFSVPNYGSQSHVRRFPSPASVWDRYGHLLTFTRWTLISTSVTNAIHVLDARRRVDSWQ